MTQEEREKFILENLEQIKRGLYGDKLNDQEGLIERFQAVEEYIENDKLLKKKVGGAIWIIGAIWTSLIDFITAVFN